MSTRENENENDDDGREVFGRWALSIAGMSHAGRVRLSNQDSFDRFDDRAREEVLLVVADGMGGHKGGEVASKMAVGTLGALVREARGPTPDRLIAAVERAHSESVARARSSRMLEGMGTTVVALLLCAEGSAFVAHVGDSRLCRLRDLAPVELGPGDAYLLCSDGMSVEATTGHLLVQHPLALVHANTAREATSPGNLCGRAHPDRSLRPPLPRRVPPAGRVRKDRAARPARPHSKGGERDGR